MILYLRIARLKMVLRTLDREIQITQDPDVFDALVMSRATLLSQLSQLYRAKAIRQEALKSYFV